MTTAIIGTGGIGSAFGEVAGGFGGEARQAVASGADVIVAHCWEAGVLCEQFEQSIGRPEIYLL